MPPSPSFIFSGVLLEELTFLVLGRPLRASQPQVTTALSFSSVVGPGLHQLHGRHMVDPCGLQQLTALSAPSHPVLFQKTCMQAFVCLGLVFLFVFLGVFCLLETSLLEVLFFIIKG